MPALSIVTPVYNAVKTLEKTAATVLAQTCEDWEWVLVDDGSTDETAVLCRQLAEQDNRIRFFQIPPKGVSTARNEGVSHAQGEYLMFLDADDLLEPNAAARALELQAQHPGHWILWRYSVGKADRIFWGDEMDAEGVSLHTGADLAYLYRKCVFSMPWNKLYRTALAKEISFDPSYSLGEDLLYCLDYLELLHRQGEDKICLAHESLIEYVCTVSGDTLSSKYLPDYLPLWEHHFERLNNCCLELNAPKEEMLSLYRQELLVIARGIRDILVRDPLAPDKRIDKAKAALGSAWLKGLCKTMKQEKCYSPYYLPVKLQMLWILCRLQYWQSVNSPWFGRLDWGGYYLLGKNWNRE